MERITVTISAGHFYIPLNIQANSKIMKVKEEIQRATHIATNEQFLIFGGKVLEDQKRISHYCIHDFSLIKMSLVMRGGGKTVKPPTNIIKSTQYTLKRFFTAKEVRVTPMPPQTHQVGGTIVSKQKVRTKETFHLPITTEWEEETTSEDEPPRCTIPAWMKFGEKEWLDDEIIDCFLNCSTDKCLRTRYLSCSTHTILNLRTIDELLHDHFDEQITHPTSWD